MLRAYHRVKINPELLTPEKMPLNGSNLGDPLAAYLTGHTRSTLPAGRVVGVTYNPYPFVKAEQDTISNNYVQLPFTWSQTDVRLLDSKNREITTETDISDFRHKSGGHLDGFKAIHMLNDADAVIRIEWKTIGNTPICGEFVFVIEQENCEC